MKIYEVEFTFSIRCITRDYTIEAESKNEALAMAKSCITADRQLDTTKFEELGGDFGAGGTWDTIDGSDCDYEVSEATEVEA